MRTILSDRGRHLAIQSSLRGSRLVRKFSTLRRSGPRESIGLRPVFDSPLRRIENTIGPRTRYWRALELASNRVHVEERLTVEIFDPGRYGLLNLVRLLLRDS